MQFTTSYYYIVSTSYIAIRNTYRFAMNFLQINIYIYIYIYKQQLMFSRVFDRERSMKFSWNHTRNKVEVEVGPGTDIIRGREILGLSPFANRSP